MDEKFFNSFNVVNEIADEIGIDRLICQSALTESLVNYSTLQERKQMMLAEGMVESEVIKSLSNSSFNDIFSGLYLIGEMYPLEPEVLKAKQLLVEYSKTIKQVAVKSEDLSEFNADKVNSSTEEAFKNNFDLLKPSPVLIQSIKMQCMLIGRNIDDIFTEQFSLGYLFGYIEMAFFQIGGSLEDQNQSLNYLLSTFKALFLGRAEEFLSVGIASQNNSDFTKGRELGAHEYGQFVKSNGAYTPAGLAK